MLLVLRDADKWCVSSTQSQEKKMGPALLARARTAARSVHVSVVIAHREYETWLVAGWPEIVAHLNSKSRLTFPKLNPSAIPLSESEQAEQRAGCDGLFEKALGEKYVKTLHQPILSAGLCFTEEMQQRSPSFKKLIKELDAIAAILSSS